MSRAASNQAKQQQKFRPTQPGGSRDSLFFSSIYIYIYILLNSIHSNSIQIQIQIRSSFLNDARELVAREVRQTCAARSGRAQSHGLSNKAVTVVRQLPYDALAVAYVNATKDEPR
jgi:hypothetical protein